MHLYRPDQHLWFIGGLPPKERVALHWKLPSCATQSFISHWLTRERGQAHWPVASSYAPLRASQLRSCMVSLEVISGFAVYVKCSPIYTILFFQILSKLKRMTLLYQKAKAMISTSKMLFYLKVSYKWLTGVIWCDVQFVSYDLSLIFFSFDLGFLSRKRMTFLTQVTWECPSKRAMWQIKAGVTACPLKIFLLLGKETKRPRRLGTMWAPTAPQENP